jgi:hypothetical protein
VSSLTYSSQCFVFNSYCIVLHFHIKFSKVTNFLTHCYDYSFYSTPIICKINGYQLWILGSFRLMQMNLPFLNLFVLLNVTFWGCITITSMLLFVFKDNHWVTLVVFVWIYNCQFLSFIVSLTSVCYWLMASIWCVFLLWDLW